MMLATPSLSQTSHLGSYDQSGVCKRVDWPVSSAYRPKYQSNWTFAILRLVGLASLCVGARGQLFPARLELSSLIGSDDFVLYGEMSQDRFGSAVAGIGDINTDGFADFAIGASRASPSTVQSGAGKTYVIFGGKNLISYQNFEPSLLNGTNGFVINGENAGDSFGTTVAPAGDVNDDGISDFLIGAPGYSPETFRNAAGRVYVIFGHSKIGEGGTFDLGTLNGTNGYSLNGEKQGDRLSSVAGSGDINGDDISDFLVGALHADPSSEKMEAGRSYVIFGRPGIGAAGTVELADTTILTLNGAGPGDLSGNSVAIVGDINDDGFDDILVGAHRAGESGAENSGRAYLIFGRKTYQNAIDLTSLKSTDGLTFAGESAFDHAGVYVSGAGDVNADGIADLLIGAHQVNPNVQRENAGRTYVIFGRPDPWNSDIIRLSNLDEMEGCVLDGGEAGDQVGLPVSPAGDINGDGISDFLIGAHRADLSPEEVDVGKTYVVFGQPGLGSGGAIQLSSLNGTDGFVLVGERAGDTSGRFIASAGDVNGDGINDILLGAIFANITTNRSAGKAYLVFGRRPIPPSTVPVYASSGYEGLATLVRSSIETLSATKRWSETSQFAASSSIDVTPAAIGGGIAAGIVALVGCGAAILWSKRRGEEKASGADQSVGLKPVATERDSINPSLPSHYQQIVRHEGGGRYAEPVLHPPGSHYLGGKELEVFNREHVEYLSAKVQDDGYDDIPQL